MKSCNHTPQYYDNFLYLFNIVNQLCQVNKWMAKRWPFSIQGCLSRFSWIMTAKNTKKIRISYGQWLLKFPRSGSKTKYEKKNWKLHTWPGQWYVFAAENENRQLKDLPQAVFGHIRGNIYSIGKEKVSNCKFWEFCSFLRLEPYRVLRLSFFSGLWNL